MTGCYHKLPVNTPNIDRLAEEITHIPLIIKAPGKEMVGRRNSLVSHIDLLPTMMAAAGMEIPPICEGENILSIIEGEERERSIVLEFNRYEIEHDSWGGFQPIRSILDGEYKLNINLLSTDELYHLKDDPGELTNLIDDPYYEMVRERLMNLLMEKMYEKRDPFRGPVFERRPWKKVLHYQWKGLFRPRPADGYAPEVLDYDTGCRSAGIKEEYHSGYGKL